MHLTICFSDYENLTMLLRNFYIAIFILTLNLLVSCSSTTPALLKNTLDKSSACCDDLSKLKYTKLDYDDGDTFHLDESSPVFQFPQGKSRFIAVELPPRPEGRKLSLTLRPTSYLKDKVGYRHYYFLPRMIAMDNNFNIKRNLGIDVEALITELHVDEWVYARFELNDDERYFVIYSDPAYYGREFKFRQSDTGRSIYVDPMALSEGVFAAGGALGVYNVNLDRDKEFMKEVEEQRKSRQKINDLIKEFQEKQE